MDRHLSTMTCANCRAENPSTRGTCRQCGMALFQFCSNCGNKNPPENKFCGECGSRLARPSDPVSGRTIFDKKLDRIRRYLPEGLVDRILTRKTAMEGERRQITVMFCDMEGYTRMTERLGSEKTFSLMNAVYEILIHCVYNGEGTINEMTGDGIVALFGAPIALENAPEKALFSALTIHRELDRFNIEKKLSMPVKMRIGINTGPVIVGTIGNDLRVNFKAIGDTVNLASRMEAMALPGTTCVAEETFKLTRNYFRYRFLGNRPVKGKQRRVSVYQLLSMKKMAHRPDLMSERLIDSEMVGRDAEINELELQVMKVINGKGSIVNIIGEPGIGKSRIIAELKAKEIVGRVAFAEGRGISIGKALSFYPIADMLKKWSRIEDDDGAEIALSKLETAVHKVFQEKATDVIPFIATLMGLKLFGKYEEMIKGVEGDALEKLIRKSVKELLSRASEMTPLVIVFEDLHWSDKSSIDLMTSILPLAETKRVLFINVFRPGGEDTGDRITKTIKEGLSVYYVEIVLEPLNEQDSRTIITNLLNVGDMHPALISQITKRTGGNPFFIEEVVRSFIDEGAVIRENGQFVITDKALTLNIPNRVNDVLMARIDRLEAETRELVKIAAVIGRNFFYPVLLDVAHEIPNIDEKLSYLTEIQIFSDKKREGEIEFVFKHALAQEAVYESILRQRREALHLQVAQSIEKIFSKRLPEFFGMLAYHFTMAGDIEKSEAYLIKAGEEALKSSASSEALQYFEDALRLYGDAAEPKKIAHMEKCIGSAFFNKGQYEDAVDYFDKALEYHGVTSPKEHTVRAFFRILTAFFWTAFSLYMPKARFKRVPTETEKEVLWLRFTKVKALGLTHPKKFFIESLYTLHHLSRYDIDTIDFGRSAFAGAIILFSWYVICFKLSRKALEFSKHRIHEEDYKTVLFFKMCESAYSCVAGDYEPEEYDDALVERNLGIGEIYPVSLYIFHQGLRYLCTGRLDRARKMVQKLTELSEIFGHHMTTVVTYELTIKMFMKYRCIHEAMKALESAIAYAQALGMFLYVQQFLSIKAYLQLFLKDISGAEGSLSKAEQFAVESEAYKSPYYYSNFLMSRFLIDMRRLEAAMGSADPKRIGRLRRRTRGAAKKLKANMSRVACDRTEGLRHLGTFHWIIGKKNNALFFWGKSIQEGERLQARVELSRTYFEIGKRFSEPESPYRSMLGKTAQGYLDSAKGLFIDIGLHYDMAAFDKTAGFVNVHPL